MIDYTENNKCKEKCGKCCTPLLPLNQHEIDKIKKYILRNKIVPSNVDFNICPFLDENKKCMIYTHRPEICKKFICSKHIENFNHNDKDIIDLWKEFFSEVSILLPIDRAEKINEEYQIKKKKAHITK